MSFARGSKKTRCPKCDDTGHKVVATRNFRMASASRDYTRRYRKCGRCGHSWTSYEVHSMTYRIWKDIVKANAKSKETQEGRAGRPEDATALEKARTALRKSIRRIERGNDD